MRGEGGQEGVERCLRHRQQNRGSEHQGPPLSQLPCSCPFAEGDLVRCKCGTAVHKDHAYGGGLICTPSGQACEGTLVHSTYSPHIPEPPGRLDEESYYIVHPHFTLESENYGAPKQAHRGVLLHSTPPLHVGE